MGAEQTKLENSLSRTFYGRFIKLKTLGFVGLFPPRSVQVAITKYISPDSWKIMEINWSEFERVKVPGKAPCHRVGEYSYRFAPRGSNLTMKEEFQELITL